MPLNLTLFVMKGDLIVRDHSISAKKRKAPLMECGDPLHLGYKEDGVQYLIKKTELKSNIVANCLAQSERGAVVAGAGNCDPKSKR